MNEIARTRVEQITTLHGEISEAFKTAIEKAIEIGRLLTEQKAELAHGEWIPWVESNLTFGQDMASKYMRVYRNQERVIDLEPTSLRQAVALLAGPKEQPQKDRTKTGSAHGALLPPAGCVGFIVGIKYEGRGPKILGMTIANHRLSGYVVREWFEMDDYDGVTSVSDKRGLRSDYAFHGFDIHGARLETLDNDVRLFVHADVALTDVAV